MTEGNKSRSLASLVMTGYFRLGRGRVHFSPSSPSMIPSGMLRAAMRTAMATEMNSHGPEPRQKLIVIAEMAAMRPKMNPNRPAVSMRALTSGSSSGRRRGMSTVK